jgi:small subunit ribosomal protein S16
MSVRVRLTRVGSKKNPIWRVVVTDQRSPRDGRFIETIGHYNPQTEPSTIVLDRERLDHWLARGAQPSGTVKQLVRAQSKAPPVVAEPEAAPVATATAVAEDPAEAAADDAGEPVAEAEAELAPEAEASTEPEPTPDADESPAEGDSAS